MKNPVWLFDLDNTLHDASNAAFGEMHVAIGDYVVEHVGVSHEEADRLRQKYWLRYGATLDDGRALTVERFGSILAEEMKALEASVGEARWQAGTYEVARALFEKLSVQETFEEFLTLPAYELLLGSE